MTDEQHLLVLLAEEAAEISQQALKAVRFGIDSIKPGTEQTNRDLIEGELCDLLTVANLLDLDHYLTASKQAKIKAMMARSRELGQL